MVGVDGAAIIIFFLGVLLLSQVVREFQYLWAFSGVLGLSMDSVLIFWNNCRMYTKSFVKVYFLPFCVVEAWKG